MTMLQEDTNLERFLAEEDSPRSDIGDADTIELVSHSFAPFDFIKHLLI
jgi:hypothetical protein